jgi:hypothetical protein
MLGLLSLAIVAAIALVGCSEAPNKDRARAAMSSRQLACGRRNLCKSEFTRNEADKGQLPELRNRQGPRRPGRAGGRDPGKRPM